MKLSLITLSEHFCIKLIFLLNSLLINFLKIKNLKNKEKYQKFIAFFGLPI